MRFAPLQSGCLLVALLLTAAATSPAHAQLDNLDKGTLIKGLSDQGMSDLLLHLIEVDPPSDPVEAQQVKIGQLRIQYLEVFDAAEAARQKAEDLQNLGQQEQAEKFLDEYLRLTEESKEKFNDVLAQSRQLIDDHRDHIYRPIWQTDLAQLVLEELLQGIGLNAREFYELGVPTAEQRKLYEDSVADIYAQLVDADRRFFYFEGELPKRDDHTAKRIDTGQWDRMMNVYWRRRTQYYLAQAAIYTSQLPTSHPYYQTLKNDDNLIPPQIQEATPDAERLRLGRRAAEALEPFASNTADPHGIRAASLEMQARAYVYAGDPANGLTAATTLIELKPQGLRQLLAYLAKGLAEAAQDRIQLATSTIKEAMTVEFANGRPLMRLLATDLLHRVLLEQAQEKTGSAQTAAKEAAYQPYLDFLNDDALGKDTARLRNYIYKRWVSSIPAGTDLSAEPALVVVAIGETARIEGQNLWAQGYQAVQEGNDAAGARLQEESRPLIERALEVLTPLLNRATLSDGVRAKAMYNLGWAHYFLNPLDPAQELKACNVWIDLADAYPADKQALEAITTASGLLREKHMNANTQGLVNDSYQRMVGILLEKYPASDAAADIRVYHGSNVLGPLGQYIPAADMLSKVPADHEDYFVAQGGMMDALRLGWLSAEGDAKAPLGERVITQGRRVVRETEGLTQEASVLARGDAKLALATVYTARGETDLAIAALDELEDTFGGNEAYVRILQNGLAQRINALVMGGKLDQATRQAEQMMAVFPEDAAIVIDEILLQLEPEIDDLQARADRGIRDDGERMANREKEALRARAKELANTAEQLAELMLQWATAQPDDDLLRLFNVTDRDDPFAAWLLARAPFRMSVAKAALLTGNTDKALTLIEPISQKFPDEIDVLLIYGNALVKVGGEETLIAAAANYDRIIGGIGPDENGQYPEAYWSAWLKRLTISDQLGEGTDDIPLRVAQLKLYDPTLGGEPYKTELEKLAAKHR